MPCYATRPGHEQQFHASRKKASYYFCVFLSLNLVFGCRSKEYAPLDRTAGQTPIFREVASDVGLNFSHFIGATGELFLPEIMGAGVALFDYDNDGDLDVYLLQGCLLDKAQAIEQVKFAPPSDHWPGARLFRNDLIPGGRLSFLDVTAQAGVGYLGYGMGAAVGDYDSDGDLDLYVTAYGPNILYQNNGDGTFKDVTREAKADDARWSTSAAFVDYDRDGDLDLFVVNYVTFTIEGNRMCYDTTGARDYCPPQVYEPLPDRLFRNDGQGQFTDVTQYIGIGTAFGNGLAVACADFDGDRWTDIFVANDGNANQLWLNKRGQKFEDAALISGAAYNPHGIPQAGMGVTVNDADNDGDDDIFVTNLAREENNLYINGGKGHFYDLIAEFGLATPGLPFTGFGTQWFDYDNDGFLDLFVANGAVHKRESLVGDPYPFAERNQLFHSMEARIFYEITDEAPALGLSEVSRAAGFGDMDNDGDIDIVVTNNNGPVRLLLNDIGSRNHWLSVKLKGTSSNRDGLGSRVAVLRNDRTPLWRRSYVHGSYLSGGDLRVHFGLGQNASIEGVAVVWSDGTSEMWSDISINTAVILEQSSGKSGFPGVLPSSPW